jgi:quercetin dioxygenase-like cupin family protein
MAIVPIKTRSRAGHELIEGTLDQPMLKFDLGNELDQLHRDESWLRPTGRSSKTLVKHKDLRVVLIAMKEGTRMQEHTAAARISVHTLSGHIRLHLPDQVVDLPAGHLLALEQSMPHDVEAVENSALLLTLSWPPEAETRKRKPAPDREVQHARK